MRSPTSSGTPESSLSAASAASRRGGRVGIRACSAAGLLVCSGLLLWPAAASGETIGAAAAAAPTPLEAGRAGSAFALGLYATVAIGFSFFCSIAEAVLLSVTPSHIAALKRQGDKTALLLEALKRDVDRPLAAILSLNTIAHTVGAAGVGAEAASLWGSWIIGWASAVMTLLILILSEIIPKTIGAVYWRPLAPWIARLCRLLIWALLPLVWLSEMLTKTIGGGRKRQIVTRDEVAAMATMSAQAGELAHDESRVLQNLLRLDSLTVHDIMTPRPVILAFPQEMTVGEMLEKQPALPVSRIPIYEGNIDHVTGFVLKSDVLLARANEQQETRLSDLRRDIRAVGVATSLSALLDVLLDQHEHIALVVDEYGGTDGLATLEDLMETLLGAEIIDEADEEANMQEVARRRWKKRIEALGLDVTVAEEKPPDGERPDSPSA